METNKDTRSVESETIKEGHTSPQEMKSHESDIVFYKSRYPDFSDALKGRTITLKTSNK